MTTAGPSTKIRPFDNDASGARLPARFAPLTRTVEAAASAVAARGHRLRFIDRQCAAAVLMLVQFADRALRAFSVVHLDERKPARLAGGAVAHDVDRADFA